MHHTKTHTMNTTHTPEPWVNGNALLKSDGTDLMLDYGHYTAHIGRISSMSENDIAIASRIVACVNACAGMEDPAAEIERLKAQRDELVMDAADIAMQGADAAIQGSDATIQRNDLIKQRADLIIQRAALLEAIKSHLDLYNAGLLTDPQRLEEHTLKLAEICTTINA